MKLDINEHEQSVLIQAIDKGLASARRARTTATSKEFEILWQRAESDMQALKSKLLAAK